MYKSILGMVLMACFSCKNVPTSESLTNNTSSTMLVKSFGADIDEAGFVSLETAQQMLEGMDSLPLKLTGVVDEVCQAKGCWMNVVSETGNGESVFVKFKDYAFFVPKDCAGKKVVMDGFMFKEITPVDELRHYAEDKGASKDEIAAITEPKEELKFMAHGVLLYEK
ncbi:MAG: DUF4920 domain-containing protein [Saprospiraceae bacterium]|nr:DUF4920 domain-containing protein [Saprospiraceae bacterium]